jgi:hypothetical protein
VALLAAIEVVLVLESAGAAFIIAASILIAARVARVVLGATPLLDGVYTFGSGMLFMVAGASLFARRRDVLFHDMYLFLGWSLIPMCLQLLGVQWSQFIRTDLHGAVGGQMLPLLFKDTTPDAISTLQARPAGFMHANNYMSIVAVVALALHFAVSRSRKLGWRDVVLVSLVTLMMAKILFLSFLLFVLFYLVIGSPDQRVRSLKMTGMLGVTLAIYYWLFPAAFLQNLSPDAALVNYAIRVADLRAALAGVQTTDLVVQGLNGAQYSISDIDAGSQSGYSALAAYLPILGVLALAVTPLLIRATRTLKSMDADLAAIVRNGAIATVLLPLISPFYTNPFFWFAAGTMLVPWAVSRERRT